VLAGSCGGWPWLSGGKIAPHGSRSRSCSHGGGSCRWCGTVAGVVVGRSQSYLVVGGL